MGEEIIKVLDDLSKRFGVAIDWTAENVLPYVKELSGRIVKYNITKNSIAVGIAFVLFVCAVLMTAKLIKEYNKMVNIVKTSKGSRGNEWFGLGCDEIGRISLYDTGVKSDILFFSAIFLFAVSIIMFSITMSDLLKWIFIPELQIVGMLKDLIGS